ncbi:MAG: 16S rRNA (cytosine(967)-C(5))-methyltransferase RsmB, partial [Nitrospirae bacterium]
MGVNNPRGVAVLALHLVLNKGKKPKDVLEEHANHLSKRDRSLAMELLYGVLRHLMMIDYVINKFSKKPKKQLNPFLLNNLRIGVYQ